jgi:acetyl-CoA carboxylase biotin carboxyl carrier protein
MEKEPSSMETQTGSAWSSVRHALSTARAHGFAEVELSIGDTSFSATLTPAPAKPKPSEATTTEPAKETKKPIKSNYVGYFRPASSPLEVGQTVTAGQIIGHIAVLGLANDVESTIAGTVTEVLAEADVTVQYGQIIAWVEPT